MRGIGEERRREQQTDQEMAGLHGENSTLYDAASCSVVATPAATTPER